MLSSLPHSCIYLNMAKCLIWGRGEFFDGFFLYLFYVQWAALNKHVLHRENKLSETVSEVPAV